MEYIIQIFERVTLPVQGCVANVIKINNLKIALNGDF